MKATGADIWDFYLNGFPTEYSHDTYDREIAYWPNEHSARGAYSLLDNDTEYDLKEFGTLWDSTKDVVITFEEAYLKWKRVDRPTFDQWHSTYYASSSYGEKMLMQAAWNAAILSMEN